MALLTNQGHLKVEAFYRSRPVFRVSPQATHEKQEKRVFARTPRAPARGLLPLATPLSRLLNRPDKLIREIALLLTVAYNGCDIDSSYGLTDSAGVFLMQCRSCGAELSSSIGATYCPMCGAIAPDAEAGISPNEYTEASSSATPLQAP